MKKCVIYVKSKTEPPPQINQCVNVYYSIIYVCGYASIETSIETGPSNLAQAEHSPLFDRELGDTSGQS